MGNGNQRDDIGEIEIKFLAVGARFWGLYGAGPALFPEVADRHIICIEEPGLCPGFYREVCKDEPFVHGEGTYPLADKFERLGGCPVHAELSHVGKGEIFCLGGA